MQCPRCSADNPLTNRYCSQCGTPLTLSGKPLPSGSININLSPKHPARTSDGTDQGVQRYEFQAVPVSVNSATDSHGALGGKSFAHADALPNAILQSSAAGPGSPAPNYAPNMLPKPGIDGFIPDGTPNSATSASSKRKRRWPLLVVAAAIAVIVVLVLVGVANNATYFGVPQNNTPQNMEQLLATNPERLEELEDSMQRNVPPMLSGLIEEVRIRAVENRVEVDYLLSIDSERLSLVVKAIGRVAASEAGPLASMASDAVGSLLIEYLAPYLVESTIEVVDGLPGEGITTIPGVVQSLEEETGFKDITLVITGVYADGEDFFSLEYDRSGRVS